MREQHFARLVERDHRGRGQLGRKRCLVLVLLAVAPSRPSHMQVRRIRSGVRDSMTTGTMTMS
jgi:hypothetical protein